MKWIHLFIIGFMMILFVWTTLTIEGKDKPKGKSGGSKFFKKAGDFIKKAGKTAVSIVKNPSKGVKMLKGAIKGKKWRKAQKRKKKKKNIVLTPQQREAKCTSEWQVCIDQVNNKNLDDMSKYNERSKCYQKNLDCMRQI